MALLKAFDKDTIRSNGTMHGSKGDTENAFSKPTPEGKPIIFETCWSPEKTTNRYETYWRSCCQDYWGGCFSCSDADLYHYDDDGKPVALNSRP